MTLGFRFPVYSTFWFSMLRLVSSVVCGFSCPIVCDDLNCRFFSLWLFVSIIVWVLFTMTDLQWRNDQRHLCRRLKISSRSGSHHIFIYSTPSRQVSDQVSWDVEVRIRINEPLLHPLLWTDCAWCVRYGKFFITYTYEYWNSRSFRLGRCR